MTRRAAFHTIMDRRIALDGSNEAFAMLPAGASAAQPARPVILCHGATDDWSVVLDAAKARTFAERLVEQGCAVVSCDYAGDAWGNAASVVQLEAAIAWLEGNDRVADRDPLFVGISMGTLTVLNAVHHASAANAAKIQHVVALIPVCDVNDIHANDRGSLAASIDAAWSAPYVEGTDGPTANPSNWGDTAAWTIGHVRMFYGDQDDIVLPATVTGLRDLVTAGAGSSKSFEVTEVVTSQGGHLWEVVDTAALQVPALVEWWDATS